MMTAKTFLSELSAIVNSQRFTAYSDGVPLELPTGERLIVKIQRTLQSVRPTGLRISKFSFITEVTAGNHIGFGFGEDDSKLLAIQKSIAEGVERAVFKAVKETSHGTPSSNGWAAHLNQEKAFKTFKTRTLLRSFFSTPSEPIN